MSSSIPDLGRAGAGPESPVLVFLPGFMSAPASYDALLSPLRDRGFGVVVPQLYRRGARALTGRVSVRSEARAAHDLLGSIHIAHPRAPLVLGGHSRGGQAAWLAATLQPPALRGLVLVDPVDGEGPRSASPTSTSSGAVVGCPSLIIGARVGGRCAPAPLNHARFAEATPSAAHVVLDIGHADILDGTARTAGRLLCGGGADPDRGRAECTALIADFVGVVASASEAGP